MRRTWTWVLILSGAGVVAAWLLLPGASAFSLTLVGGVSAAVALARRSQ